MSNNVWRETDDCVPERRVSGAPQHYRADAAACRERDVPTVRVAVVARQIMYPA